MAAPDFAAETRCGPNGRAVLAALRDIGQPATVLEVLARVAERGEWESAGHPTLNNTPAQRGEPYRMSVYQYLHRFEKAGIVQHAGRGKSPGGGAPPVLYVAVAVPASNPDQAELVEPPMRARAQEAIDLRAAGLDFKAIAERMGISRSYAHELVADPTGQKARDRKAATECETPGCTRPSRGERRCHGCRQTIDGLMPTCRIERFALRVARERRITINFLLVETGKNTVPFERVVEVQTPRGKVERKLRKGDTWSDGLGACGIEAA